MQRAQKWQMAAQIALRNLGAPAAAEEPSPRPQLARYYSAVTSRELDSKEGSGWPGSPAGAHRPAALKRSLTGLLSPRASQLLSQHSQWGQEPEADERGAKRQALATAVDAPAPVTVPTGSGPAAPMPQQHEQQQPEALPEGTGGTPSAGPSRRPSGDSFAFPAKREPTPPTPRSATAVTAAAATAAAAAPTCGAGGPSALPEPMAAATGTGAATGVAMHRAAMLALQADALHRMRRGEPPLLPNCLVTLFWCGRTVRGVSCLLQCVWCITLNAAIWPVRSGLAHLPPEAYCAFSLPEFLPFVRRVLEDAAA